MVADAKGVLRMGYPEMALHRIQELVSGLVKEGIPPDVIMQIVRDTCRKAVEERSRNGDD